MKASHGLVIALVVFALVGIGALAYSGVSARRDIDKGTQNAADNAQKGNENPGPHAITASADSGGSISPSGSTSVLHGSSQTFIATANTGYRVADVLVDGQSVGAVADLYHDDSSSYTFDDVAADHVILASFALQEK